MGEKIWITILLLTLGVAGYAFYLQVAYGHGVTGMRDYVVWGIFIVNFMFLIGLSYAGAIIAGFLHLFKAQWGKPLIRLAQLMTLASVIVGPIFILLCVGRFDRLYHLFIYPRLQSPLTWDVIAVMTLLVGSFLFLYLGLIRDFAVYRDSNLNIPKWKHNLYRWLALGYNGLESQKKLLLSSQNLMAFLLIPISIMVASILSKKIAAGSTHLVLDIPIGPTAKVRSMPEAQRLRRLFEYVAGRMHLALDVVITDGRQPIGNGVGPVLEARDVMQVLQNDPRAPIDLRQKALRLAGRLIECDPDVRGGDGFAIARDILDSGRALSRMNAIIEAQGSRSFDPNAPRLGALSFEVRADASGVVAGIDNVQIARIARLAGAPKVPGAGLDLLRKLGHAVAAGDLLYRVHADFPADLEFARQACERASGFTIGGADAQPHVFVEF